MKKFLFSIVILLVTLSFTTENGKESAEKGSLSGFVTYKNSSVSSIQADAGCEIYAISKSDISSSQYTDMARVVESFQRSKSEYFQSIYNTIDPVKIKKAQNNFDVATNFAFNYLNDLKLLPNVVKGVTSGSGKYAINLRPGQYYVLFISGNLKSNNIPEFNGNVVIIKSSGTGVLDLAFEKSENTLFMLISKWQRQGC